MKDVNVCGIQCLGLLVLSREWKITWMLLAQHLQGLGFRVQCLRCLPA